MRGPWQFEAPRCSEVGGDFFFPERGENSIEVRIAKNICSSCIHKTECAEWAVAHHETGIWGGTTEHTRRKLRKKVA